MRGDMVSCEALRAHFPELRPRLHVAGRIHAAHGACVHKWDPADGFAPPSNQNGGPVNLAPSDTNSAAEPPSLERDEDLELRSSSTPRIGRRGYTRPGTV